MVPYLTPQDLTTVDHAMVISRLDYCNPLYVGLLLNLILKLQLVQNAMLFLLTVISTDAHTASAVYQIPDQFQGYGAYF